MSIYYSLSYFIFIHSKIEVGVFNHKLYFDEAAKHFCSLHFTLRFIKGDTKNDPVAGKVVGT